MNENEICGEVVGWRSEAADDLIAKGPLHAGWVADCMAPERRTGPRCDFAPGWDCFCGIRVCKELDPLIRYIHDVRDRMTRERLNTIGGAQFFHAPSLGLRSAIIEARGSGLCLPRTWVNDPGPRGMMRCERAQSISDSALLLTGYADPNLEPELTDAGWNVTWVGSGHIVLADPLVRHDVVWQLLSSDPEFSDEQIALRAGLTVRTVAQMRADPRTGWQHSQMPAQIDEHK